MQDKIKEIVDFLSWYKNRSDCPQEIQEAIKKLLVDLLKED